MLADRVRMGSGGIGGEFYDNSGSPGSPELIAGNGNAGFFGEVPASQFITGDSFASLVGLSEGTSQFSNEPWLKFAIDGKILFVAKKPIRHSISWDEINAADCVYGGKTVQIGGHTYRVRLMKGALTDPVKNEDVDRGAIGSEWNRLMLPIHVQAKDKSWDYSEYVENDTPYWGIDYTDADLQVTSGDGRRAWCQETTESNSSNRVYRGGNGVSYSYFYSATARTSLYGWRPVLELV